MLIRRPPEIPASEITPPELFHGRRRFLQAVAHTAAVAIAPALCAGEKLANVKLAEPLTGDTLTPYEAVTTYNNFYEFGTGKEDPSRNAGSLKPDPWSIVVEGEVEKPQRFDLDTLLRLAPLEERIYRFRCVEAWSMVVPWIGYPLAELLKRVAPTSAAKYVEFTTLLDPAQMPGQRGSVLPWPYREGLRMDEAMHPLTLLTVGLYGEVLPNQNGAPVRIIVPWKYGFKSAKSIVSIRLTETRPATTWQVVAPREYGFYANVNPAVDHPRWSQAKERRLGDFFKRPTLLFNGYGEQVASLYSGMDLKRDF